ncbi:fungal specific transcription factor domain-containing protein [Aspergillus mulundensis]|uniref:C6 zinc finger protein n=1 Tax=Aspergillus mulundensis TaxID=1810919 RepID=A0A3D8SLD1_9EURO|nr:C6 zinc finger protein [Aspergillus mulundensis]RDW87004.1 C6 zinc finger protein [Aspergillus mulundensis]
MYPCAMCSTYGYSCTYNNEGAGDTTTGGLHFSPFAEYGALDGERHSSNTSPVPIPGPATAPVSATRSPTNQSDTGPGPQSSTQSPAVAAATSASPGIFDAQKFRHSGASAAMAFPHILGVALGSHSPPKTRSFAYNFGVRPEETSNAHCFLANLISQDDLAFFSDVYFSILGPIGDVIDPQIYAQRCQAYYLSLGRNANGVAFAAVAAGIAALGSFLSRASHTKHPRESELVAYAKSILDDPASMRLHGIDHIVAWGLRVLYLRATTRPSNAWIASCTQMHLAEAIGLHLEENVMKMAGSPNAMARGHDADRLRRIFWVSWAGHVMLCYEYDREPVRFGAVTCGAVAEVAGSVAGQFVKLIQIIPSPNSPFQLDSQRGTLTPSEELIQRLGVLDTFHTTHPFLVVTKADIAFAFYRRLYTCKIRIPDEAINVIIDAGNAAVDAATQQATQGHLFWNVIGSVFQYACILLAVDTPTASAHLGTAFRGLEDLVQAADTPLTREALGVARHLLCLSKAKKRRELELLEGVEAGYRFSSGQAGLEPGTNVDAVAMPDVGVELDWDQFFIEPFFSLPWPDVQL